MISFTRSVSLPSEGLNLFRRGLGLLCLINALGHLTQASFFLSDLGVLPRSLYFSLYGSTQLWSLFHVSGRPSFAIFLLLLMALLGALQVFGRNPPAGRILLFVVLISLHNRNPAILDSSDDLLKLMVFWDLLLPSEKVKVATDFVSPATLGLQIQLSIALVMLSYHAGQGLALESQWSGRDWWAIVPYALSLEIFALSLLALSLWWRPLRELALVVALPGLLIRAFLVHPAFPLTLAVALTCLVGRRKRSLNLVKDFSRFKLLLSILVIITVLGLNFVKAPALRPPFVALGQGMGLLQNWSQVYPLAAPDIIQLVARAPDSEAPVWSLSVGDGRRMRLFAQRIGQNTFWSSRLPSVLSRQVRPDSEIVLWMRKEPLRDDYLLGEEVLRLLSLTPVSGTTHGRVVR